MLYFWKGYGTRTSKIKVCFFLSQTFSKDQQIFSYFIEFGRITCFGMSPWSHMPMEWSMITNPKQINFPQTKHFHFHPPLKHPKVLKTTNPPLPKQFRDCSHIMPGQTSIWINMYSWNKNINVSIHHNIINSISKFKEL